VESAYIFIKAHWDDLLLIFTSIVTVASVIAKLTPNKWDDTFVARIVDFLALSKKK
jgi:hypothetical protein